MAKNRRKEKATRLALPVPDGTVSGDPLVIGDLPCVAVTDESEWTEDEASVQTDGSFVFDVFADNAAIDPGDIVYLQNDGSISDDNGGKRFGYALEAVSNGATTGIEVKIGY